jgi:acyl carrier protein
MKDRIKLILKQVLELDEISDDISQQTCAAWDSMHYLQIVLELENEFNVSLEPEDIAEMRSLKTIERQLNKLLEQSHG